MNRYGEQLALPFDSWLAELPTASAWCRRWRDRRHSWRRSEDGGSRRACHEMNNVHADGKGCPVFYRCFSCRFFTTDFTHLPQLRQLRATKAEHLARLQASYGTLIRAGPLTDANLRLLAEEIAQLDMLIGKCETDLASLTADEQRQVKRWLAARDRYATVIPVEALTARQQRQDQPTFDPVVLDARAEGA